MASQLKEKGILYINQYHHRNATCLPSAHSRGVHQSHYLLHCVSSCSQLEFWNSYSHWDNPPFSSICVFSLASIILSNSLHKLFVMQIGL